MAPDFRSRRALPLVATVATAVVAAICVVAVVLWNAPANWLAQTIATRTGGTVLLADAEGTIRSGSAVLALGAPGGASAGPAPRFALPGRITWTLDWGRALAPVLHLKHDGVLLQPIVVRYASGGLVVDAGTAVLPASMLELVGPPLNTLRPAGRCTVQWQALAIDGDGVVTGAGTLRVDGFALALSPVRPLGDYRVDWTAGAPGLTWQVATENGPLELAGNGTVGSRGSQARVAVRTAPTAPAAVVAALSPLLDMIGRQGTGEAIIETGRPR